MKQSFESLSPEDTEALGRELAKLARPGDVFTLTGDLGAGKTFIAGSIARGLGISEYVTSPTFTILQIYDGGRMPLYHFDVYRIGDSSEMEETGYFDFVSGDGLCLIEWAELIEDVLPDKRLDIIMEKDNGKGSDYRRITIDDLR